MRQAGRFNSAMVLLCMTALTAGSYGCGDDDGNAVSPDAGTPQALLQAANFVQALEDRQGMKIACVEEIAYRMGYINMEEFKQLAETAPGNGYASYLRRMLEEEAYAVPAGTD